MKNIYSIITVLVFTFGVKTFAQSGTNLEELLKLIDTSTSKISQEIGNGFNFRVNFISPSEYKFLKNRTIKGFRERTDTSANYSLNVIMIKAQTAYTDVFRDGFLGSFKVNRKFDLELDYTLERGGRIIRTGSISESASDTTDYDKVKNLEMMSLPFTRSELPPEPFFSGLLEPAVAIGSAAVAIYLLFAVRSK